MGVYFSGKISNAVMTLLETHGEDLSPLYEQTHLPVEWFRDSSYWVSAPEMEDFLQNLLRLPLKQEGNILQRAGHEGAEIRAWGVLDSVLRMMPRPHEIFNQPEQFLSYFISPKPPIDNLRRDASSISFDLPLPAEQYPLVTTYLKAAFESLPVYIGQPLALCEWTGIRLKLNWSDSEQQKSIFEGAPVGRQVSPDLFKDLLEDLQRTQREREDQQKYIGDLELKIRDFEKRNLELTQAQPEAVQTAEKVLLPTEGTLSHLHFESESPSYVIGQNLARLHDYMVRAQQLITMLAAQGKMTPAVKEAMRRVDWDFVKSQYPRTIHESMEVLRKMNRLNDKEGPPPCQK